MAISKSQVLHFLFVFYVLVMVLVFLVPVPRVSVLQGLGHPDKTFHFVTFAGFAFLYQLDRRSSMTHTLLVSLAFAGGIELVQWVLPYRSGDWWDFFAGAAGAGIGVVLTLLVPLRAGSAEGGASHPR
jgi:glycopeptide antibiotics resistance protein